MFDLYAQYKQQDKLKEKHMPLNEDLRYWVALHFKMTFEAAKSLSDSEVLAQYRAIPR